MSDSLSTLRHELSSVLDMIDGGLLHHMAQVLVEAPRLFCAGEGRSGFMAKAFAMRLMHLGLSVNVVGETVTPGFGEGDLLVVISGSGSTAASVRAAQQAVERGAIVVAVTTDPQSALASIARDIVVIPASTKLRRADEPPSEQPLGSLFDQCTHLVLDAVCMDVGQMRSVSLGQARKMHASE
jgi:6-phospho-3-hexuloisomerase